MVCFESEGKRKSHQSISFIVKSTIASSVLKMWRAISCYVLCMQGNVPSSQLDEKKLVGYAQLNIIE